MLLKHLYKFKFLNVFLQYLIILLKFILPFTPAVEANIKFNIVYVKIKSLINILLYLFLFCVSKCHLNETLELSNEIMTSYFTIPYHIFRKAFF